MPSTVNPPITNAPKVLKVMAFRATSIPVSITHSKLLKAFTSTYNLGDGDISLSAIYEETAIVTFYNFSAPPSWLISQDIRLTIDGKRVAIDIDFDFFGMTTLYSYGENAEVDIIAVTGLAGHPIGSWKARSGRHVWLIDDLPNDIERCRVLTYGYDSKLLASSDDSSIYDYGKGLLEQIVCSRQSKKSNKRPLILLAHSLGGLIVKEALYQAGRSTDEEDRQIARCTVGVLFFGVPNLGLDHASLHEAVKKQRNERLLAEISVETPKYLHALQKNFMNFRDRYGYHTVSFYETKDTSITVKDATGKLVRDTTKQVRMVTKESATCTSIVEEDRLPIQSDHGEIVKFDHGQDQNYMICIRRMKKMIESAPKQLARLKHTHPSYDIPFELKGAPSLNKFLGREEELGHLCHLLPSPLEQPLRRAFVIIGEAGMGKTLLAAKFAEMYQALFSAVFWIDARNETTLIRSQAALFPRIPGLAIKKTADEEENTKRRAAEVREWLSRSGNHGWLLIFDNVTWDGATAKGHSNGQVPYNLEAYFPRTDQGSIIITTRRRNLEELGEPLYISGKNNGKSVEVLRGMVGALALQKGPSHWTPDAPPLGNHRAGNPLSSVVAQADTKKRGITSSDYLRPHTRPSTEPQKQQKLPASTTNKISQSVNDNSKEDLVPRHNINLPALYSKGSSVINSRNRSNSNTASKHIAPAVTIPHGPSRIPWSRKKSYITRDPRPVDTDSERSGKTGGLKSVNKFFGGLLRKEKAVR